MCHNLKGRVTVIRDDSASLFQAAPLSENTLCRMGGALPPGSVLRAQEVGDKGTLCSFYTSPPTSAHAFNQICS